MYEKIIQFQFQLDRSVELLYNDVAIPGPTRAQALVKFVCALVKLFYLAQHQATWSPVL